MSNNDKMARALYVRELDGARRRVEQRRQNQTFFYIDGGMRNDMNEEIEYSVRYSRWGCTGCTTHLK